MVVQSKGAIRKYPRANSQTDNVMGTLRVLRVPMGQLGNISAVLVVVFLELHVLSSDRFYLVYEDLETREVVTDLHSIRIRYLK